MKNLISNISFIYDEVTSSVPTIHTLVDITIVGTILFTLLLTSF